MKNVKDMFKKFVYADAKNLDKRFHEEICAQLALKYCKKFNTDLKKTQLDSFYEDNGSLTGRVETEVKAVLEMMASMAADVPSNFKKQLAKGKFHALADAIQIAYAQGYSIKDPKRYMEWFLEIDAHASAKAMKLKEEQKEQSWIHWKKFYANQVNYNKSRQLISDQLNASLNELIDGSILRKKRTHKDCFIQKDISLHLWVDQGHKDRNDNEISILDIYLGRTQVDHVKSVRDGGTTTYDNAELMTATDNLKKGASSNEPYFEHQKVNPMDELTKSICNPEYVFSEDETLDESE